MTVKEVWEVIATLPPDTPVVVQVRGGGYAEVEVGVQTVAPIKDMPKDLGSFVDDFTLSEVVEGEEPFLAVVVRRRG